MAIDTLERVNNHAVETAALVKRFGDFTAVNGVTFTVGRGEIFGFLGPNGAGKTTTMRMLMGLIPPTSGSATVLGFDVIEQTVQIRRRIGYMSQRFSLYNDLTVEENLNFFGGAYDVRGQRLKARKADILAMAGLEGRERELAKNLSGGWRQRLALGCALVHEPEMLFLDEPTAGVDPISRREFWNLLYLFAGQGRTIFVTTHYMDEAEHCSRLSFIQHGELVALGSPEEIKREKMRGQVLEIDCTRPDVAVQTLRAAGQGQTGQGQYGQGQYGQGQFGQGQFGQGQFGQVTLYGALVHVVAQDVLALRPAIEEELSVAGLQIRSMELIAPSLEDVFIASATETEPLTLSNQPSADG
jgi:ABC-2 type transport system ATP-binding protein